MKKRTASITFGMTLAFSGISLFVCLIAGFAAWAQFDTIEEAAKQEVERVAEMVAYASRASMVQGDRDGISLRCG